MKQILNRKERLLLWSSNLWYFGEGMFGPFFAVFTERVGGSILDVGWAEALYLFCTGIGIIFVGRMSDRGVSKEWLAFLGYALNAVLSFAYLLVHTTTGLFLVQFGLGIALALASPTWSALFAKYENKKEDGSTWGIANGDQYIARGLAVLLGGAMIYYASFPVLFIVIGCVQIVAALYQGMLLQKRHVSRARVSRSAEGSVG